MSLGGMGSLIIVLIIGILGIFVILGIISFGFLLRYLIMDWYKERSWELSAEEQKALRKKYKEAEEQRVFDEEVKKYHGEQIEMSNAAKFNAMKIL